MSRKEENTIDQFITKRMLRYCKEAGLNYYESARAMHLSARDRSAYESEWING